MAFVPANTSPDAARSPALPQGGYAQTGTSGSIDLSGQVGRTVVLQAITTDINVVAIEPGSGVTIDTADRATYTDGVAFTAATGTTYQFVVTPTKTELIFAAADGATSGTLRVLPS